MAHFSSFSAGCKYLLQDLIGLFYFSALVTLFCLQQNFCTWSALCNNLQIITCTPRMPNMMKNVAAISTMFPMGFKEVIRVSTTTFRPGALLITLNGLRVLSARKTRNTPKMELSVFVVKVTMTSIQETTTKKPSITFHVLRRYAPGPTQRPRAITWGKIRKFVNWRNHRENGTRRLIRRKKYNWAFTVSFSVIVVLP